MNEPKREADENRALVERITARLLASILSGELPLGSKVNEKTLATGFGVSRGPLREAIRSLEGRGLIQRLPNLGPRVVSLSIDDILKIYIVREALEGMCARMATELMSDEELRHLKAQVDSQLRSRRVRPQPAPSEADLDFHQLVILGARNDRLEAIIQHNLFDLLRIYRARSETVPGRGLRSIEEHRDIVSAMLERDPALAESLMRRHVRNASRNLVERMRQLERPADEQQTAAPRRTRRGPVTASPRRGSASPPRPR